MTDKQAEASETPLTDALFTEAECNWKTGLSTKTLLARMEEHARDLERRLRAAEENAQMDAAAMLSHISDSAIYTRADVLLGREGGYKCGCADTLAKVVAWLEREAVRYGREHNCGPNSFGQLMAALLRSHPQVIDQDKP